MHVEIHRPGWVFRSRPCRRCSSCWEPLAFSVIFGESPQHMAAVYVTNVYKGYMMSVNVVDSNIWFLNVLMLFDLICKIDRFLLSICIIDYHFMILEPHMIWCKCPNIWCVWMIDDMIVLSYDNIHKHSETFLNIHKQTNTILIPAI